MVCLGSLEEVVEITTRANLPKDRSGVIASCKGPKKSLSCANFQKTATGPLAPATKFRDVLLKKERFTTLVFLIAPKSTAQKDNG